MAGKYEKRRIHRKLKALGIPFMESQKLARIFARDGYLARVIVENAGFQAEDITLCPCCGPEAVQVTFSNGRVVRFGHGFLVNVDTMK